MRGRAPRRGAEVGAWLVLWGVVGWCVLGASSAAAEGTHFISEAGVGVGMPLGYTASYDPGVAVGATLGFGGKFKGNPTRFFLIGQFNTTGFEARTVYNDKERLITRQMTDVSGGLRVLWPINRNLRVFADVALGIIQVDSEARSPGLSDRLTIRDVDSDLGLFTAAGVQYRFAYHFSVGAKADFGFLVEDDDLDVVSAATEDGAGGQGVGRLNMTLVGTLHF